MNSHRLDFVTHKVIPTKSVVLPVGLLPDPDMAKTPELFENLSSVPNRFDNQRGSVGSLEFDDQQFGPQTQRAQQNLSMRPSFNNPDQDIWGKADKPHLFNESPHLQYSSLQKSPIYTKKPAIVTLNVQLDWKESALLKIYEDDDPEEAVAKFGLKHNMQGRAVERLNDQVMQKIRDIQKSPTRD